MFLTMFLVLDCVYGEHAIVCLKPRSFCHKPRIEIHYPRFEVNRLLVSLTWQKRTITCCNIIRLKYEIYLGQKVENEYTKLK